MEATITMRYDDWHIAVAAIDAEIEHINDYIKESDDEDEIRTQRTTEARLEAIREYILSATYAPVAGHPLNAHQPFISR